MNTVSPIPAMPSSLCYGGATYTEGFIQSEYRPLIKQHLLELPWETKRTARHEYFMSNSFLSYSYGKQGPDAPVYESKPMTNWVSRIQSSLNTFFGAQFNACFLNKYDDHHQHLGWHADDFEGMDPNQPIAVLSFGAEREIWLKNQKGFHCPACGGTGFTTPEAASCRSEEHWADCEGYGWMKAPPGGKQPVAQRRLLQEGSLFVMPAGYQGQYFHRIPKHDRPCGWRISLTFRSFLPPA